MTEEATNTGQVCYICQEDSEGQIPSPCECKGTLGSVHATCLRTMRARSEFSAYCRQCLSPWTDVEPQFLSYPLLFVSKHELNIAQALVFYALFPGMQWLFANRFLSFVATAIVSQLLRTRAVPNFHECIVPTPTLWFGAAWAQVDSILMVGWLFARLSLWLVGQESQWLDSAVNWSIGALFLTALPVMGELFQRMRWFNSMQQRWAAGIPSAADRELFKQFKEGPPVLLAEPVQELLQFWLRWLAPAAAEFTVAAARVYDPHRFTAEVQRQLRQNYMHLFQSHPQLGLRIFRFNGFLERATVATALLPWPSQTTPTWCAWAALAALTAFLCI